MKRHGERAWVVCLMVLVGGGAACSELAHDAEPAAQVAGPLATPACAAATAEDSNTRDSFGLTAAAAQASGYSRGAMEASQGCSVLAQAKCRAQGPKCNPGAEKTISYTPTTNSAEEEALDTTSGGPVTNHYTGSATLTSTLPASWVPSSTTPGNTARAKQWKVNVTLKIGCEVACSDVVAEAGADVAAPVALDPTVQQAASDSQMEVAR